MRDAETERAAVVAYLRWFAKEKNGGYQVVIAADMIEKGEHRK